MPWNFSQKYPSIAYDSTEGQFYKIYDTGSYRKIFPDTENNFVFHCVRLSKVIKRKAANLAWEFMTGEYKPKEGVLYFRDHDPSNIRYSNLLVITEEEHRKIKDALYNIKGGLIMQPHKSVAFAYVVRYKYKGRIRSKMYYDVVTASRFKRRLTVLFIKILAQYNPSN